MEMEGGMRSRERSIVGVSGKVGPGYGYCAVDGDGKGPKWRFTDTDMCSFAVARDLVLSL